VVTRGAAFVFKMGVHLDELKEIETHRRLNEKTKKGRGVLK